MPKTLVVLNSSPEYGDVVGLDVFVGDSDSGFLEEFVLEFVHLVGGRADVEQDDLGVALNAISLKFGYLAWLWVISVAFAITESGHKANFRL